MDTWREGFTDVFSVENVSRQRANVIAWEAKCPRFILIEKSLMLPSSTHRYPLLQ